MSLLGSDVLDMMGFLRFEFMGGILGGVIMI